MGFQRCFYKGVGCRVANLQGLLQGFEVEGIEIRGCSIRVCGAEFIGVSVGGYGLKSRVHKGAYEGLGFRVYKGFYKGSGFRGQVFFASRKHCMGFREY